MGAGTLADMAGVAVVRVRQLIAQATARRLSRRRRRPGQVGQHEVARRRGEVTERAWRAAVQAAACVQAVFVRASDVGAVDAAANGGRAVAGGLSLQTTLMRQAWGARGHAVNMTYLQTAR